MLIVYWKCNYVYKMIFVKQIMQTMFKIGKYLYDYLDVGSQCSVFDKSSPMINYNESSKLLSSLASSNHQIMCCQ